MRFGVSLPSFGGFSLAKWTTKRTTSTTELNRYKECRTSSTGRSSGTSNTKRVNVFCGRHGMDTWAGNRKILIFVWCRILISVSIMKLWKYLWRLNYQRSDHPEGAYTCWILAGWKRYTHCVCVLPYDFDEMCLIAYVHLKQLFY